LIHNSINEVQRAQNAAHTTLYNAINAFNALNFTKFVENSVEDPPASNNNDQANESENNMFGNMTSEDDRLSEALALAL